MEKWEEAHEIILKIRAMNFDKYSLERILGVMIQMLVDGGSDMTKIEAGAKLMLALRSPNGIQGYLDSVKPLDKELRAWEV